MPNTQAPVAQANQPVGLPALSYELAAAHVAALTGQPAETAVIDVRMLHDTDKSAPGHARRGTLPQIWPWIEVMQATGHGAFINVSELDGEGRELANVVAVRAHVVDLDKADADQQRQAAAAWSPAPSFQVETSPGRFHLYWCVSERYNDHDRYTALQRRIRQQWNGDRAVVDPTRVLRLSGTYNFKRAVPHMVRCEALAGYGQPLTVDQLEASLAHVVVQDGGTGDRHPLGSPDLAAPSLPWLKRALELVDPNELGREDWIALTAAVKQAGWTLTDEDTLFGMWSEFCARYDSDDPAENLKQWRSIRSTELGWQSLVRRVPSLKAALAFGENGAPAARVGAAEPPPLDCSGEYLTAAECAQWFKGCTFVTSLARIMTPDGKMLRQDQFNGSEYAGKKFIVTSDGKATDEPWRAALRSTLWTIPKVDHVRFLPDQPHGAIVTDALGRKGVNIYKPANVRKVDGDVSPFLDHITLMLPDEGDRRTLTEWMAHVVKFPGHKIPWAPVIQSTEGIGKGVLKAVMAEAIGLPYVHFPNSQELAKSGGTFNGWMRNKLFILADEIKVGRADVLVERLKDLISEELIEIQNKGVDQEMADNAAQWMFFSNWKDAVPVHRNGRRYAVFYSPIQTEQDLLDRGMGDDYFKSLFAWVKGDGAAIVANWLHTHPIKRGDIPMRAPKTTSWGEAVDAALSPLARRIADAVEANAPGFAGGWISTIAITRRLRATGWKGEEPTGPEIAKAIRDVGKYYNIGRASRPYIQEDKDARARLWSLNPHARVEEYGAAQGYE